MFGVPLLDPLPGGQGGKGRNIRWDRSEEGCFPPSQGQYLAVSSRPHIQRAMSGFCRSSSHAWDHHLPCNIVRLQKIPWNPKVLVFLWIWYSFQLYCEQMFLRLL